MMTMPKNVLASVGFDAFCHCMEAYISRIAQPFTDIMCEKAMKLIADDLPKLFKGDNNPEYWDKISLASTMGGMVINLSLIHI